VAAMDPAHERLSMKTKLAFGVGASAETIALFAVASWAMLYYNQVLGVPAYMVGIALSISLVLDGLTEPIVGSWSDRTKSKLGRRHPWMFAAPIPIALSFYGIWNPPAAFNHVEKAIWCGVMIGLIRQVMTFFHTPHLALGGELSPNYIERSKVMAYNSFFGWAGGAGVTLLGLTFFVPRSAEYRNGLLNPEPWQAFSLTFAVAIATIIFISTWFTKDRIPYLPQPAHDTPKFSAKEFFGDVVKALTNRNYVWLLVGYFFLSLMLGLRENLRIYLYSYYWELTTESIRLFVIGSFFGFLTAFLFAARLHGRFDKKRTIIVSLLAYSLIPVVPIAMGMTGILTPASPGLIWILIAFAGLTYCAFSILAISTMSALADIADENELRHGVRQEGILYSTRALSAKMDQAIGSLAAGSVISLIGLSGKVKPGEVDSDVLHNLALWDGPLGAVPGVIAAFFYARYRITKATYEETKQALALRRASLAAAPAE
jgi:Na+/melibiose symporter-like transporter